MSCHREGWESSPCIPRDLEAIPASNQRSAMHIIGAESSTYIEHLLEVVEVLLAAPAVEANGASLLGRESLVPL